MNSPSESLPIRHSRAFNRHSGDCRNPDPIGQRRFPGLRSETSRRPFVVSPLTWSVRGVGLASLPLDSGSSPEWRTAFPKPYPSFPRKRESIAQWRQSAEYEPQTLLRTHLPPRPCQVRRRGAGDRRSHSRSRRSLSLTCCATSPGRAGSKLRAEWYRPYFGEFGSDIRIGMGATFLGAGNMKIGDGCFFDDGVFLDSRRGKGIELGAGVRVCNGAYIIPHEAERATSRSATIPTSAPGRRSSATPASSWVTMFSSRPESLSFPISMSSATPTS